ncbi:MAG: hypothetical protein ACRENS_12655 [Candidatus Eiseniibacteriota bacterium]
MKLLKWILPGVALAAVIGNGCIITSTQVLTHFSLTNPIHIIPPGTPMFTEVVDLNTIKDYADNKDKLGGLSDVAVVGTFTNLVGPAGGVEIWITPGVGTASTIATAKLGSTLLWGPGSIAAAPSTRTVNWNDSATLFNDAGKKILIDAMKGAGVFTVYIFPSGAAGNTIDIVNGAIILVIAAGV